MNKVILIGHLGQNPEMRFMPDGNRVANVSMATTERWKDAQGQRQERTEWHRIVFYRRLAEIVGEYLAKGSKVMVEGRLQTRQWEKDGVRHCTTEIIGDGMEMLDRKADAPAQPKPGGKPPEDTGGSGYHGGFDDDIPF